MHNDRVKGEAHTHTKKSSEIEGACWWDEMTWVPETESLRLKNNEVSRLFPCYDVDSR